jgi:catechol 2,3-dioxygenase-like lactoylglutathione lyase family enzyme
MAQIRHLAFCCDHPGKVADFYARALGFQEIARYGFDPSNPDVAPRPSAVMMTDGHINIAILKLAVDQTGVGISHLGFHHFGVVVDDISEWTRHLTALGAPNITTIDDIPEHAHMEIKFRGPEGIVFDISPSCWPGSAAVPPNSMEIPTFKGKN